MSRKKYNLIKKLLSLFTIFLLVFTTYSNEAYAEGGLIISTPYTGITVKAGESVKFPLEIKNVSTYSQNVNISIVSAPRNWKTTLEGRGKIVHKVFVEGNSYQDVDLTIDIPADTKKGDYQVVIEANGNVGKDRLTLDLKVREQIRKESKLVTEYPELQGTASTNFNFRVDIINNSNESQSYSLGAQVPRGWQVEFTPAYDSKQIASITVEPNRSEGLDIEIKPPHMVKAGEYTIPITAISSDEKLTTELKVVIKGTYDIKLTTPTGRLNADAYAGKKKEVKLLVINTGTSDLKDVKLHSWEPRNWSITFEPEEISLLKAGESKEVKAYIKPDDKAITGDYEVEMRVSTPEASSGIEMRVMVKTSTLWGFVGIVIIALMVYGLYLIFKKYGRR
jgi:uncharacterized membrane protein